MKRLTKAFHQQSFSGIALRLTRKSLEIMYYVFCHHRKRTLQHPNHTHPPIAEGGLWSIWKSFFTRDTTKLSAASSRDFVLLFWLLHHQCCCWQASDAPKNIQRQNRLLCTNTQKKTEYGSQIQRNTGYWSAKITTIQTICRAQIQVKITPKQ